jgi:hypothetical protein
MRSKKINRHHIVRQNFMGYPKKITLFHLENFQFGQIRFLKKYLLNEFGLRECTKILVFGVDLKKFLKNYGNGNPNGPGMGIPSFFLYNSKSYHGMYCSGTKIPQTSAEKFFFLNFSYRWSK